MKHEEKRIYSAPEIEVLDVVIEKGFAQSGDGEFSGGDYPSWPGDELPL
ncbi:MAG: hypothetical protein IKV12_00965 [Alistipes sp.]|nr:hypothetical protein [Alistipes sp.]